MRPFMFLVVGLLVSACAAATGAAQSAEDASAVVDRLRAQGLPIGEVIVFTAETDPNNLLGRPNQYTSKATFLDTRLPRETPDKIDADDGGTVEVFANEAQAEGRQQYVDKLGQAAPMFVQYSYRSGRIYLRLSKRLTPAQAGEYEAALRGE